MNQDYLAAYIQREHENKYDRAYFQASAESIASIIVSHSTSPKIIFETLTDDFLLSAAYGFIDRCYDQNFLMNCTLLLSQCS